jgi:arginine-tRNA-protein transferase
MIDDPTFPSNPALALYLSQPHDCSYLPGRQTRTLFLDPAAQIDQPIYQALIDRGYRRSGRFLYQPACPDCSACISLRLPVRDFQPTRSQRRCWKRNAGRFCITARPPQLESEQFALYQKYLAQRHPDSSMDYSNPDQYIEFLHSEWGKTRFYEFRLGDQLAAVVVTDHLPDGLSSVYTFFDPDLQADGIGIFALLWQIEHARQLGLKWVYPGFWIRDCQKMRYKSEFRPLEAWSGQGWVRFAPGEPLLAD